MTSEGKSRKAKKKAAKSAARPTLLAGGDPQIAKADGDAPVQANLAAMPGWKGDVLPRRVPASSPPVESKKEEVRYFHIHEDDELDLELVASWIGQAAELPGERCF